MAVSEATRTWCVERDHPWATYSPWLDRSYCRCGERQAPGEQPTDWRAKREVFHSCASGTLCRCYAAPRGAGEGENR